jgi:hypothetical protein
VIVNDEIFKYPRCLLSLNLAVVRNSVDKLMAALESLVPPFSIHFVSPYMLYLSKRIVCETCVVFVPESIRESWGLFFVAKK